MTPQFIKDFPAADKLFMFFNRFLTDPTRDVDVGNTILDHIKSHVYTKEPKSKEIVVKIFWGIGVLQKIDPSIRELANKEQHVLERDNKVCCIDLILLFCCHSLI